jgi:ornithine cyclodeaminase/alanine dehydrogenase-like protein (mu-crystallin family)
MYRHVGPVTEGLARCFSSQVLCESEPMVLVLDDDDVAELLTPDRAVSWMREAVLAAHAGRLVAPPRVHADLGEGRLVFTTGTAVGDWFGYRSYDSFDVEPGEQVVVVHDARDGRVRGLAVGNELGPRRVGAIGAVAVDALAAAEAHSLALVGTGRQAWTQLWAIASVRELHDIRVFSRDPQRVRRFVDRVWDRLGLPAAAYPTAEDAVDGAGIVVLATNSPTPVVDSSAVAAGAFVSTLGPKQVGRAEFGIDLAALADHVVTDSPAQLEAYDPPYILHGTPEAERVTSLGAVLAGDAPGRTSSADRTLFCSVGLAGTEVFLLDRLLRLRR